MAKKFNLIFGDCLAEMETLITEGTKVDMILCDLPYGTTACSWDAIIPFEQLWSCYKRLIKENGAIVLFGSQPFTTDLINSNRAWFKYEIIWEKSKATGHAMCNLRPLKAHENIIVFCEGKTTYNPQFDKGSPYKGRVGTIESKSFSTGSFRNDNDGYRYPRSIVYSKTAESEGEQQHETQKPLGLVKWLVATYSNENDMVMDNTMGSGTTGEACMNLGRQFIGIENDKEYFEIAEKRISAEANQIKLFFGEEKN